MIGQKKRGRPRKTTANTNLNKPMQGLYTGATEDSFKTAGDIRHDAIMNATYPNPTLETPLPQTMPFDYWQNRFESRQQEYCETRERTNHAVIRFYDRTLLTFIGDLHAGSADTDYETFKKHIEAIVNTPNSYAILLGDIIDGYFFNSAQMEEIEQVPEQIEYYQAILKYLPDNKKLLVGFGGDHCNWAAKMGHSANADFSQDTGAYYMNGVGYVSAKINDIEYKITGVHRPQGSSIYNNAHGAMRLGRDAEGSDIVVTAHQHSKGVVQQGTKEFAGAGRLVTYIAVGAYKRTDSYSQKMGFADNPSQTMFGASVILEKDTKTVTPFYDILQAHQFFTSTQ